MKKIKNLKMMWKFSDETGNYEVSMPMLAVKAAGCVIALLFRVLGSVGADCYRCG